MTARSIRLAAAAFVSAMAMLQSGCEHKDLCYDHSHYVEVDIRIHWDKAPDADPETMVVSFFTPDGRYAFCREFSAREGGKTKVEAGEYLILLHNGEMETVHEIADSYGGYRLVTEEETLLAPMSRNLGAPPRPSVSADEPVRSEAETIWAGRSGQVELERGLDGQRVDLYPEEATARYTVEVTGVENLRDNISISAALTGLSEHLNVSTGTAGGRPVTVPFGMTRSGEDSLGAGFLTFDHCPGDNDVRHILSVYTSDKTCFNFDVTGQVHSAPDRKNILIRIDGLKLPPEGSGMSPTVDGWDDEERVDIEMD